MVLAYIADGKVLVQGHKTEQGEAIRSDMQRLAELFEEPELAPRLEAAWATDDLIKSPELFEEILRLPIKEPFTEELLAEKYMCVEDEEFYRIYKPTPELAAKYRTYQPPEERPIVASLESSGYRWYGLHIHRNPGTDAEVFTWLLEYLQSVEDMSLVTGDRYFSLYCRDEPDTRIAEQAKCNVLMTELFKDEFFSVFAYLSSRSHACTVSVGEIQDYENPQVLADAFSIDLASLQLAVRDDDIGQVMSVVSKGIGAAAGPPVNMERLPVFRDYPNGSIAYLAHKDVRLIR